MDAADVAVATITLAREPGEEQVLREALGCLARHGLRVAVADGGSPQTLVEFLRAQPRFTLAAPRGRGLLEQVKASLAAAREWGTEYILYTEPDKQSFFEHHLHDFIARAPTEERTAIVIAARSAASLAADPPIQQYTEGVINQLCGESLGHVYDYSYGPFLIRRHFVEQVLRLATDLGWGWRPYVFCAARRLGYAVRHVVDDFPPPDEPPGEDRRAMLERIRQLNQNIEGLLLAMALPADADRAG